MSEDFSKSPVFSRHWPHRPYGPFAALLVILLAIFGSETIGSLLITFAPRALGWDSVRVDEWILNSALANFLYVVIIEALVIGALILFLRYKKVSLWHAVGLRKPGVGDVGYAVIGWFIYFLVFVTATAVINLLLPIDVGAEQALGFQKGSHGVALLMAFVSLVILPPLVEEIIFRGFLFGALRSSKLNFYWSTLVVSLIFAAFHLRGGTDGALLWIAFIDTFVLSVMLCYMRERTGSIWASIGIHAIKNGVVFVNLFILGNS